MADTPKKPELEDVPVGAIRQQQHTWNHEERPQYEKEGNEAFGGTRKGAENIEGGDGTGIKPEK